jgi:hypothetical protein
MCILQFSIISVKSWHVKPQNLNYGKKWKRLRNSDGHGTHPSFLPLPPGALRVVLERPGRPRASLAGVAGGWWRRRDAGVVVGLVLCRFSLCFPRWECGSRSPGLSGRIWRGSVFLFVVV